MPRALGYVATSATTEVAVNSAAYNEQSSNGQRSIKSASANDAAAGTGVRTVKLTYFSIISGVVEGPFTETLTLNGTTAVPTVATNIGLVDKIEALTVGSGGVAAGAISLFTANDGTGTAIAAIAAGDRRTYLGQTYVPSGRRLTVTDIAVVSGEAATFQTRFNLRALYYGVANAAEQSLTSALASRGLNGTQQLGPPGGPIAIVQGPARVRLYVTPGDTTGTTQRGEFGYYLQ